MHVEHEGDDNANCYCAVESVPKFLHSWLEQVEKWGKIETVVEIGQNTEKCPVDLNRLADT